MSQINIDYMWNICVIRFVLVMVSLNAFIHLIQTIFDFAYITLDTGTLQPVKNFKYSIEKVSFLEIFVIFFHFHQLHFQFEEARLWSRIFLELYSWDSKIKTQILIFWLSRHWSFLTVILKFEIKRKLMLTEWSFFGQSFLVSWDSDLFFAEFTQ